MTLTSLSHGVASSLRAALTEGPEKALAAMLDALAKEGIRPAETASEEPWLVVEHAGRRIALCAEVPPDPSTRELLSGLLLSVLIRAAEHVEHRRVCERMEMLASASFEGIMIHVDGVVIDVNERLGEILGRERAEMLGDTLLRESVAPEDLANIHQRMLGRVEGEYLITGVRKDGTRFRAELLSKQGQLGERPVRVVAVRDVTRREHTSQLLKESETQLRNLTEQVFDVVVTSRDGVILGVAGRVEEMLGFSRERFIGAHLTDFVAPCALPLARDVIAEQRVGAFESVLLDIHGASIPVEIVGVQSTLGGEPVRVAGLRDLRTARRLETERLALRTQVERSQRLESLGVLAGGIAHDFNNLLVGILGNAELLDRRLQDSNLRKHAQAVRSAGERAATLTRQMLAYAGQGDRGRREPVDMGALFEELRALLDASLSKKAKIELALEPDTVVLGERATLMQVLMNLLTNASDALQDEPGTITVRASRVREPDARWRDAVGATVGAGEWVLLEVQDTGVGMDESTRERVFEPFFSTKETGHGLGLAACLGIVSAHDGAILVESGLGRGSTFSVLLPATKDVARAADASPDVRPRRPCRVLVIDDEPHVRWILRGTLEALDYRVEEASDGRSGLDALVRFAPDVVLLDMTMPDLDGAEVVKRIRETGSRVPIVVSSGYHDTGMDKRLLREEIQGFLSKPYSTKELLASLDHAVDKER